MAGLDPVEIEKISVRQLETLSPERGAPATACKHRQDRLDMTVPQIPRRAEEGFNNRHGFSLNTDPPALVAIKEIPGHRVFGK